VRYAGLGRDVIRSSIKAYFVEMGSQGGKLGGLIRAHKLNPEPRKEIAVKPAAARWKKPNAGTT
jgi:hypothetical protein